MTSVGTTRRYWVPTTEREQSCTGQECNKPGGKFFGLLPGVYLISFHSRSFRDVPQTGETHSQSCIPSWKRPNGLEGTLLTRRRPLPPPTHSYARQSSEYAHTHACLHMHEYCIRHDGDGWQTAEGVSSREKILARRALSTCTLLGPASALAPELPW